MMHDDPLRWRVAWFYLSHADLAPYVRLFNKTWLRIDWHNKG